MGVLDQLRRLFGGPRGLAEPRSSPSEVDHFKRYIDAYERAEATRKEGNGTEARALYELAISECEKVPDHAAAGFVPPAPYTAFAKMLYHMGEDDEALRVIDRYLDINGRKDEGASEFREKIASGSMRRLRNKYR